MLKHETMMLAGAVALAMFSVGLAFNASRTSWDRESECECKCDSANVDNTDGGGLHYGLNLSPSGKLQFGLRF